MERGLNNDGPGHLCFGFPQLAYIGFPKLLSCRDHGQFVLLTYLMLEILED